MSARYFCDVCGKELERTDYVAQKWRLGNLAVEVSAVLKESREESYGHVCSACIRKAVTEGEPVRPEHGVVAKFRS
jgi:Flp pilus assembly protein CpaB